MGKKTAETFASETSEKTEDYISKTFDRFSSWTRLKSRVVTWYMGSGLKVQNMTGIRAQRKRLRAQKNGIRDHKAFKPESGIRFITRSKNLRDQNNGKKIGISGSRIYQVTTLEKGRGMDSTLQRHVTQTEPAAQRKRENQKSGFIRVGGRLHTALINVAARHPIILIITKLLGTQELNTPYRYSDKATG